MSEPESEMKKMLRLQRELMELSPQMRRDLLGELPAEVPAPPKEQRANGYVARTGRRRVARRSAKKKTIHGESVESLAVKAVLAVPHPLWAGDVLAVVRKTRPSVKSVNVYAALYTAADGGKILKEMVGNKARYSRPQGAKKAAPPM